MVIKTVGYASLKRFTEHLHPKDSLSVPDGATVKEVLKELALPVDVKVVTMINGRHCALDQPLEAGDKLVFFPPLEGG